LTKFSLVLNFRISDTFSHWLSHFIRWRFRTFAFQEINARMLYERLHKHVHWLITWKISYKPLTANLFHVIT